MSIQSAIELPGRPVREAAREATADILIRFGPVAPLPPEAEGASRFVCQTGEGTLLAWPGHAAFLVRDGREILVEPAHGAEAQVLRSLILGPALGVALFQRGLLVFHASVVSFAHGAVAFLAFKGQGKSTLASILHRRGHDLLTDDILALDVQGDHLIARPGFPLLKLWADTIQAMGEDPESYPLLHPSVDKRMRHVSRGFARHPMELACVYVLGDGQEIEIVPLEGKEALLNVLPHWYGALFDGDLLEVFGLGNHLRQCARLVQSVPVFRLQNPRSLSALPDVAQIVEAHRASSIQEP